MGGTILGAGLLDAGLQGLSDFLSGDCLSPEQYAWRMLIALEFGLLAGITGAAATIIAVYLGAPLLAAAAVGLTISFGTAWIIDNFTPYNKNYYLDWVLDNL